MRTAVSKSIIGLGLALSLCAVPVFAKPALKEVRDVSEGIITVGMAYEISQQCEAISARLIRGLAALNDIKAKARDLGYSDEEIEAYVDDRSEKARLEAIAHARLEALGAVKGEPESYCSVGSAEMAKGSQIGRLIR